MFLKSGLLSSVMLIGYLHFFGQSGFPYDREWKGIDSLMNKKSLPKSALVEVNKIYASAKKDGQEAQWIKAVIYRNRLRETDDRNISETVTDLEKEIIASPPRVAAVLKSIEAEAFDQYLMGHRYDMRNRSEILSDESPDISSWTMGRLNQKIRSLYLSSLDLPVLMKQTRLDFFDPMLIQGNSRDLRPTLFDLLAYRALDYFSRDIPEQDGSSEDGVKNNRMLFSESSFFMHFDFSGPDSSSNQLTAIKIYQQLLLFHAKDLRLDAWLAADISRIQFVYQMAGVLETDSLYMNALGRITRQWPSLSVSSQAWYLQAAWWAKQARIYDPLKDTLHQFDYVRALAFCEQGTRNSDSSEGRSNCEELAKSIRRRDINLNIEQVNLPEKDFRVLVTYKNFGKLFARIIRIGDANRKFFAPDRSDNRFFWSNLTGLRYDKEFEQPLPEVKDYQSHRVEIKVDALGAGEYVLLVSSDARFSDTAAVGMARFFSSSIAFVNNENDYFLLDRDSGHPLSDVHIKATYRAYGSDKKTAALVKYFHSDARGHFYLPVVRNRGDHSLEFFYGKDYFTTRQFDYYYRYRDATEEAEKVTDRKKYELQKLMDNLFTDRAIYRPGQNIYFKSLLITRDFLTREFKPAPGLGITIFLKDVNGQKVDSVKLKSNDFGSVHGNFHIPENRLNGEFSLTDNLTSAEQSVSVEEYKRPTFYVQYDSIKTAYRVGDTIKLSGTALSYSGSPMGSSRLSYRIYRDSRYPYPWMFRFYPSHTGSEIAHGEMLTDLDGRFNIYFPALPESDLDAEKKPLYDYRVETTITDPGGESRSAVETVSAGYQSFQILSSLPLQSRISKYGLYQIPLTTKNISGVFIREKLTISMYALRSPGRLIRARYWMQPDQFVMSEAEYIRHFPFDEYQNEADLQSWKTGEKILETTDSTRPEGFFKLDQKMVSALNPGMYELEFKAMDKDGQEMLDKRFVEITSETKRSSLFTYNLVPAEALIAEPGSTVTVHTGSDAEDIYVIRATQYLGRETAILSYFNLNREIKISSVPVHESERGGFALNDCFIKNNRWYSSQHRVEVPWTNKELKISYLSWRDKSEPGSLEKWKIQISGEGRDRRSAEVLTSMYDASLDQFEAHSWNKPDIYPVYKREGYWDARNNFEEGYSDTRPDSETGDAGIYRNNYDALIGFTDTQLHPEFSPSAMVSDIQLSGFVTEYDRSPIPKEKEGYAKRTLNVKSEGEAPPREDKNMVGPPVQIRRNFNETAFFLPDLRTDSAGNVEISFTMPDALTQWKWMVFAFTKDLSFGYTVKAVVSQKELMVQTNMPRFFREGDTLLLPVKIANLSGQPLNGTVELQWLNAASGESADQLVGNLNPIQPFSIVAAQSSVVFFPTRIPSNFNQPLLYRITARTNEKNGAFSDGEEALIPVLSNRMLVTESLPLNLEGKDQQHFVFDRLIRSKESSSLQNQLLTVEFTSNPAWYAVQALPYLMEFPYECAEQTFNRYYANVLATHIVQVSPAIQAVFEEWKNRDTSALLSNLQKNEALKSVFIQETPWILQAQTETQQKKNLALLFDLMKMQRTLQSALDKLSQMQSGSGGFPWFKGGRDDRYITQYILAGIGRLNKLKAIPADAQTAIDKITRSGIAFLDDEMRKDYKKRLSDDALNLNVIEIQYLYMRSFFPGFPLPADMNPAYNYYRNLARNGWTKQSVYMQGMIALFLSRTGDKQTASDIIASLQENAVHSSELGLYWKSVTNGYYWQEAPVETQSLLIEVFQELHVSTNTIDQMKYWLLQQKRTQHWPTTKATADACYALLLSGSNWLSDHQTVSFRLGDLTIRSSEEKTEAGSGYFKQQIPGDQVKPEMGNIDVSIKRQASTASPSWGAVYWQYFEDMDKISAAPSRLMVSKKLYLEKNTSRGPVLESITGDSRLKPGDKLKIRIIIKSDRDLEYIHLKDERAACLEPVNVLSGYQWADGLSYYQTTQDASTSFFFDRLPRGEYVLEYPVFVGSSGDYSNGISSLQCMYAPEFNAHSEGIRIHVVSK